MMESAAIAAGAVWALAFAMMSYTGLAIFLAFGGLVALAIYHYPRGRRGSNRKDR